MIPCRSCGGARLELVLSLGTQPLANALPLVADRDKPQERFPLDLAFCPDCALVQITETVPPEKLFSEYLYFSSYSTTMLAHAKALVDEIRAHPVYGAKLNDRSIAVEVGSNDGYLLTNYQAAGIPVLGIDPARNIAEIASARGVPTRNAFFGKDVADALVAEGVRADVLHAHNVLAHVADLNGFVAGIATLLAPEGTAVIEAPYVRDFVEHVEFDTIYHEHLCYFGVAALDVLFRRHHLRIVQADKVAIHGGSLRLYVRHEATVVGEPALPLLDSERAAGLHEAAYYKTFSRRVERLRTDLLKLLDSLRAEGAKIAGYGAAAKCTVLANYCGLDRRYLAFVADRNEHKQGRIIPGVNVEVVPPARILDAQPDILVVFAWNVAAEVMAQQAEFARRGGKFIVPIPTPRVVQAE